MKQIPLLMTGPNVNATLEDRKTQTRRANGFGEINKYPDRWRYDGQNAHGDHLFFEYDAFAAGHDMQNCIKVVKCRYGNAGDVLYVRETFYCDDYNYSSLTPKERSDPDWRERMLYYAADGEVAGQIPECEGVPKLVPSIHMPRWACRLFLEVKSVRAEKLGEITEADARAEGVVPHLLREDPHDSAQNDYEADSDAFIRLWNQVHGAGAWERDRSKWVWVISYKRTEDPGNKKPASAQQ